MQFGQFTIVNCVVMSEQWNVSIMIFLTLRIFAKIVCLFLQRSFVFAAIVCLFLQFRTIVCQFLRCHCCETAEDAFKTLKWFAELMVLAVDRILTRRSIMTREIEVEKEKKIKKKFWNLEFKEFLKSSGLAKSKRTCKIQKNLQNPKGFAESEKICKIQKNLRNSKEFAEIKRICREFSVYKLILLFTRKRTNRR